MAPLRRVHLADDRGQVAGIEVLPFGVLIFVLGTLVVANAWAVVDAKMALGAAAREALRAYVEAPDETTASAWAERAAHDAAAGHGRDPERLALTVDQPGEHGFGRCQPISVRVAYRVPALVVPVIGGFGRGIEVHAEQRGRVDPYRDGLSAGGRC